MTVIPLGWQLSVKGADEVKAKLNEINEAFKRDEISATQYSKGLRQVARDARALNNIQNLQKNIFLASHPAINRLSKSMSTFSSVARTALTITNALNLARIATSGVSSSLVEAEAKVSKAQREVNKLFAEGKINTDEYQSALEALAIAQADVQELTEQLDQQKFTNFITAAATAVTAVSGVFNLLLKSDTIRSAVVRGATSLGKTFGIVFTAISSGIIRIGTWLSSALFSPKVASRAAVGGAAHGGIFGGAFNAASVAIIRLGTWFRSLFAPAVLSKAAVGGAASGSIFGIAFAAAAQVALLIALPAIIAGAIDVILENLTGQSFVRALTGGSVRDHLGIPLEGGTLLGGTPHASDLFEQDERKDKFKGKPLGMDLFGFGKTEIDSFSQDFDPLKDLFKTELPEAYGENEAAFAESWMENIPQTFTDSTNLIQNEAANFWNAMIEGANLAAGAITDGLNSVFRSLFEHMNHLISAYNRAARELGRPTISQIQFVAAEFNDIPTLPAIAAAKGFNGIVDKPTLFLAGEAGSEAVSITPGGGSGGGGGTTINQFNIGGSVIAERHLLKLVDNAQKSNLKRRGF